MRRLLLGLLCLPLLGPVTQAAEDAAALLAEQIDKHLAHAHREPIQYPTLSELLSKELGDPSAALPNFVSIGSRRGLSDGGDGAGFLGPEFSPLLVGRTDNDPYKSELSEKALAVPDPAVVWFLFCDGHVHLFSYDTPRKALAALISPGGGETIDIDY